MPIMMLDNFLPNYILRTQNIAHPELSMTDTYFVFLIL
jgi:hypothetical protein